MKKLQKEHFVEPLLDKTRSRLNEGMTRAKSIHSSGAPGREVVKYLTGLMEEVSLSVWRACWKNVGGLPLHEIPAALVAVGGFGRGEMNPRSDLDLLIFHPRKIADKMKALEETVEIFIRTLWDLKLDVAAAIRTEKECINLAADDPKVKTALIDSRVLSSTPEMAEKFNSVLVKSILTHASHRFIEEKTEEIKSRRKKYGDSVFLLEPHVKEGEGGLRDIHTALWIAKVTYKTHLRNGLLLAGAMTKKEHDILDQRLDFVWRVRNALHFITGRKEDRLTFDVQEKIAASFGYKTEADRLPVEVFMKDYYLNADAISVFADRLIDRATGMEFRFRKSGGITHSAWGRLKKHKLDDGFILSGGDISTLEPDEFTKEPLNAMNAFHKLANHRATFSRDLKELLYQNSHELGTMLRTNEAAAARFRQILQSERAIVALEAMHETGFLGAYIPEFEALRRQVQHDAYHIYTTDIHSIFTFMLLKRFVDGNAEERHEHLMRVAGELEDSYILLLSGLFHDIGKGVGKKHSSRGAKMVERIAARMKFTDEEAKELKFLVRNHLIMAETSQKRDLADEKMISRFAKTIGSESLLKKLYLLTAADLMGVGPDNFTVWKADLLKELYEKALRYLEKGYEVIPVKSKLSKVLKRLRPILEKKIPNERIEFNLKSMPARFFLSYTPKHLAEYIMLMENLEDQPMVSLIKTRKQKGFNELIIATPKTNRTFSKLAGVLSSMNINIMGADIFTRTDGVALDRFIVNSPDIGAITDERKWKAVKEATVDVLTDAVRVEKLVSRMQKPSVLDSKLKPRVRPPKITVDNASSDKFTILEVYAPDRVGLLYEITHTLSEIGLYIELAIITTHVDQIADIFYVRDIFKHKITEPSRIADIKSDLFNSLFENHQNR